MENLKYLIKSQINLLEFKEEYIEIKRSELKNSEIFKIRMYFIFKSMSMNQLEDFIDDDVKNAISDIESLQKELNVKLIDDNKIIVRFKFLGDL